jgi:hypothetical protein
MAENVHTQIRISGIVNDIDEAVEFVRARAVEIQIPNVSFAPVNLDPNTGSFKYEVFISGIPVAVTP